MNEMWKSLLRDFKRKWNNFKENMNNILFFFSGILANDNLSLFEIIKTTRSSRQAWMKALLLCWPEFILIFFWILLNQNLNYFSN